MAMIGSKVQHNQGIQAYQAHQGSDKRRSIRMGYCSKCLCEAAGGIIVEKIH